MPFACSLSRTTSSAAGSVSSCSGIFAAEIAWRGVAGGPATQQSLEVHELLSDPDPVVIDVEQAQVVRMFARADLDRGKDSLQLAVHFDVPLHDDRVGQEGCAVGTEAQIFEAVFKLRGHEYGCARGGQRRYHARERLAKVLTKSGCQRELESRQRIDDDAAGLEALDLGDKQSRDLVNRHVERAGIDH